MKIQHVISFVAAGLLVASGALFVSCEQPTKTVYKDKVVEVPATTDFSGTATRYFDAHGGGYVGEAIVTTDKNGAVTDAVMNEWQGPSGWAEYPTGTSAFAGGETIRFAFPGKNATTVVAGGANYAYFYYNINSKGWVELTLPTSTTNAYTAPKTTTAAATPNFDAKMANPLYAKAYVDACKASAAGTASALQNVTLADAIAGVAPVLTVGASATSHYTHLNKSDSTATYMPISASSIGYRENTARLITFFKAHPTADYSTAATASTTWTATSFTAPSATYTATSDSVWAVSIDGADVVTGATYSDFVSYASELQNAYLFAISENKGGDLRALK